MSKKRVVMVDDSVLARAILREILEGEDDMEVVGEAQNAYDAIGVVDALKPDLVTMDIDMPGPSGLDAIEWLMQKCPVPILVITSERLGGPSALGFQAIQRGALDFSPKPAVTDTEATVRLRNLARTLARVPIQARPTQPPPMDLATRLTERAPASPESLVSNAEVVAIAAGIGGPRALSEVIKRLPKDFPSSILIVQHMPPRFADGFARFLRGLTAIPVSIVAKGSQPIVPGEIYVCDGSIQPRVPKRGELIGDPSSTGKTSADILLTDLSASYGSRAIGVVMSGSGDDGASGLLAMRAAGCLTIAERVETAIPAEMPRAAMKRDAVVRPLSAELIADYLLGTLTVRSAKTTAPPSELKVNG